MNTELSFQSEIVKKITDLFSSSRRESRSFNHVIKEKKFVMLHSFLYEGEELAGTYAFFTDDNSVVFPFSDDRTEEKQYHDILSIIERNPFYLTMETPMEWFNTMKQTTYISTELFSPIEVTTPTWQDFINAPSICDRKFGIDELKDTFIEYYHLSTDDDFEFSDVFLNKELSELDIRQVWCDTDSSQKYGDIIKTIHYKGEFIGWISNSGRWLDTQTISTVDLKKWKALMADMYELSGYVRGDSINGVYVHDMNSEHVEDCVPVPGFSEKEYNDE